MGLGISKSCDSSDCFIAENTCFCSSENWKSYQMDLNTVMIFDETKNNGIFDKIIYTADVDVVTVHFKCSACNSSFQMVFYYFEKACCKYGQFCRILTTNDPIPIELVHDSLKPILDSLAIADKVYTSKKYARDLFNAMFEASAEQEAFAFDDDFLIF